MKYYAVKKGLVPGIYTTWSEAKANVKGFPGAQFKSFKSENLALEYMNGSETKDENAVIKENLPDVYAFCDGSFNPKTNEYGFGAFIMAHGARTELTGHGIDKNMAEMRNVAGEILGAQAIINKAIGKYNKITLYYDYMGIEKWATGKWKAIKPETRAYKEFMHKAMKLIDIEFVHVKGHSGIEGNEYVDKLAKQAVGLI